MKTNITINLTTLIIAGVILLLAIGGGWKLYSNKVAKLNDKVASEIKLRNALIDTVTYHKNKNKELVAEKLTIQLSLKELQKMNGQLTQSEKELTARIKEAEKNSSVITAALIKTQARVDSLLHAGQTVVDTTKKTVTFTARYVNDKKMFNYGFTIGNVLPFNPKLKPTLRIDSLFFPNTQFVSFNWKDNRKEGYPISFNVSNSNGFFSTVNIDSYAIPELNKTEIKPNFWKRVGNFFSKSGNNLIYIGTGGVLGAATYWYLTK